MRQCFCIGLSSRHGTGRLGEEYGRAVDRLDSCRLQITTLVKFEQMGKIDSETISLPVQKEIFNLHEAYS